MTPTASGKTLCYNLPVLNAVLESPDTRVLYLFRPKRLPRISWLNCRTLRNASAIASECLPSGDTPSDARKAIRERGHIVLTNPDMLHTGILPHHTKWMRLFENLRYIILDELHTYRGVFGSHLNVLRQYRFIFCGSEHPNPDLFFLFREGESLKLQLAAFLPLRADQF